jgi:hypothetical protein
MKLSLKSPNPQLSRRAIIKSLGFAPFLLRSAPIFPFCSTEAATYPTLDDVSLAEARLSPHYPVRPPLADILKLVPPGSDDYPLEKFAVEIESLLENWSKALQKSVDQTAAIGPLRIRHGVHSAIRVRCRLRQANLRTNF